MFRYWSPDSKVSRAEANDAPCTHCARVVPLPPLLVVPPPATVVPPAPPLDAGGPPPDAGCPAPPTWPVVHAASAAQASDTPITEKGLKFRAFSRRAAIPRCVAAGLASHHFLGGSAKPGKISSPL